MPSTLLGPCATVRCLEQGPHPLSAPCATESDVPCLLRSSHFLLFACRPWRWIPIPSVPCRLTVNGGMLPADAFGICKVRAQTAVEQWQCACCSRRGKRYFCVRSQRDLRPSRKHVGTKPYPSCQYRQPWPGPCEYPDWDCGVSRLPLIDADMSIPCAVTVAGHVITYMCVVHAR